MDKERAKQVLEELGVRFEKNAFFLKKQNCFLDVDTKGVFIHGEFTQEQLFAVAIYKESLGVAE